MNVSKTEKLRRALRTIAWIVLFFASLITAFTASFFATDLLYKSIGLHPSAWLAQVVNSLLGIVLFGLVVTAVVRIFQSKQIDTQMGVFGPLIEAMSRIAKGDFSVRLSPTHRDDGPFRGVIGELVNSVNNMASELDQMEKMRQEFISNVSHEIQSPLTSIRGFAQALQNEHLSAEERSHYLTIVENESTRLSRITDNLLKLATLESDKVKIERKPYRLDKQIRHLILACEPQWMDKGIDMDASLEEVEITADEDLLSQVWNNLIHNSIKFTPEGGRVCVALRRQAGNIEFKITDTGIGISEADQARVFERR